MSEISGYHMGRYPSKNLEMNFFIFQRFLRGRRKRGD
jgi:hypothetical protein